MDNIRLQNFRSLKDTGVINIKPLTLLVGKNSSGKSSFLRFFPLLKQSLEEAKHGPILWYKDVGVDFGDFLTTVTKGQDSITLSFEVEVRRYHFPEPKNKPAISVDLVLKKEIEEESTYDYIQAAHISYGDVNIELSIDREAHPMISKVSINGETMPDARTYRRDSLLFPYIRTSEVEIEGFDILTNCMRKGTRYVYRSIDDFLFITFQEFDSKLNGTEYPFNKKTIFNKLVYSNLYELLRYIEDNLRFDLDDLVYIGPFRDAPQRYYRMANLSANTIDMNGSNMAVYIKEMGSEKLDLLNRALNERFGFTIEFENQFGQISLYIVKDNVRTNIIDNGFGYSQILPILLATYQLKQSVDFYKERAYAITLCVEQPELHLHPTMQFNYGRILADTLSVMEDNSTKKIKQHMIVETHSRSIIEAIGASIADKKINRKDVAVYLFEDDPAEKGLSKVRLAEFDEEGYLLNWPIGFLD